MKPKNETAALSPEEKKKRSRRSRAARQRGARAEYGLRNYLRMLDWKAERVPCSGASNAMKGDVIAEKGQRKLTFEVKNHNQRFIKFWAMLDEYRRIKGEDLLSVFIPYVDNPVCDISTSLEAVFNSTGVYELPNNLGLGPEWDQTLKRLPTLRKMLGGSDILVLHENRKPWLFLRFR